jgi:sRNA-binding carbon storage regulator CsrA
MLVLSRCPGEEIHLHCPGGVTVTLAVVRLKDGKVRRGIAAPPEVVVTRPDAVCRVPRNRSEPRA